MKSDYTFKITARDGYGNLLTTSIDYQSIVKDLGLGDVTFSGERCEVHGRSEIHPMVLLAVKLLIKESWSGATCSVFDPDGNSVLWENEMGPSKGDIQ